MRSAEYAKTLVWDKNVDLWIKSITTQAEALLNDYLTELVNKYASVIEDYMKTHALWQDQTGLARRSLRADVEILVGNSYSIILDHGEDVYYGVWLELKYAGRYAIIQPTLDTFYPQVINELKAFLRD